MAITSFNSDASGTALKKKNLGFPIFAPPFPGPPPCLFLSRVVGSNFAFTKLQKGIPTDSAQFANTAPFEVSLPAGQSHWKSLSTGWKAREMSKVRNRKRDDDATLPRNFGSSNVNGFYSFLFHFSPFFLFSFLFYRVFSFIDLFYFVRSIINIPIRFRFSFPILFFAGSTSPPVFFFLIFQFVWSWLTQLLPRDCKKSAIRKGRKGFPLRGENKFRE